MKCPRCEHTLTEAHVDEVVLDRCTNCGGIWLDFAQLERVLSRESRSLRTLLPPDKDKADAFHTDEETMNCPRCSGTLLKMRTNPEGVCYYGCLTCYGRWLDGREMVRIIGQPLASKFETLFRELLG